jgi:hypothetical protein
MHKRNLFINPKTKEAIETINSEEHFEAFGERKGDDRAGMAD